ncbi:MAG: kelch repeat-containing protein, partial [Promethearchaeota archaeon]
GWLNDLWRFNITSEEWAWMSGNKTAHVYGVYGTKGVPDMANYPGSRTYSVSWADTNGSLWLFGGWGWSSSGGWGNLNDLWRFNITSKEWAWMSGNKIIDQYGVYGSLGVPDVANYPGARYYPVSWTDTDGDLWLFGGWGYAESSIGVLNDLWKFGPAEISRPGGQLPSTDDDDDGKPKDDLLLIVGITVLVSAIAAVSVISVILIKKRSRLKRQT